MRNIRLASKRSKLSCEWKYKFKLARGYILHPGSGYRTIIASRDALFMYIKS